MQCMAEVDAAWQADRVRQELEAEGIAARLTTHRIRCGACHDYHSTADQVFECHTLPRIVCGNCKGIHRSASEVAQCYAEADAWEADQLAELEAEAAFARSRERLAGDGMHYDLADWL